MKLSDIKGERTFDVIADVIEPIANIAEDEVATEFLRRKVVPDGKTPREFAIERAKKSVPVLLKTHKKDLISILATIKGVPAEEYEKSITIGGILHDFVELISDDSFISLFMSAQSEGSSGSARENTTDKKA